MAIHSRLPIFPDLPPCPEWNSGFAVPIVIRVCRIRRWKRWCCQLFGCWWSVASVISCLCSRNDLPCVKAFVVWGLSRWDEGSDSDHVTGLNRDKWLVGHCKILAGNGPSYHAMGVRGRLRFDRSLSRRDHVSLRRKGSQVKQ